MRDEEQGGVATAAQDGNTAEKQEIHVSDAAESYLKHEGEAGAETSSKPKKSRRKLIFIGAGAVLILAVAGLIYWLYARQFESTDDAFIDADITEVSPKVSASDINIQID